MSAYTKPIIRVGIIPPVLLNSVLLAAAFYGISKINTIRNSKLEIYQEQTLRQLAIGKLEQQNGPNRKIFADQKSLLQADPGLLFTKILDRMLSKYKEYELDRNSLVFPLDRGNLGKGVKSGLARVKSTLSGGLGPMQEALLQVESLIPQAVLEELKITRKSDVLVSQQESLLLETTHTCWKAEEINR